MFYADSLGFLCALVRFIFLKLPAVLLPYSAVIASALSGSFGGYGSYFSVVLCTSAYMASNKDPRSGIVLGYVSSSIGSFFSVFLSPTGLFLYITLSRASRIAFASGFSPNIHICISDPLSLLLLCLFVSSVSLVSLYLNVYVCNRFTSHKIQNAFGGFNCKSEVHILRPLVLNRPEKRGLKLALISCSASLFVVSVCFIFFFKSSLFIILVFPLILFIGATAYGVGSGSFKTYILNFLHPCSVSPLALVWIILMPFCLSPFSYTNISPFCILIIFRICLVITQLFTPFSFCFKKSLQLFNFYSIKKRAKAFDLIFVLLPYALTFIVTNFLFFCIFAFF